MAEDRLVYLIAGGRAAMFDTLAEAEDDEEAARRDGGLCTAGDTVIAIAASGSTPYTLAATRQAKANGATIIAMVNNAGSPLETLSDIAIILDTGPEVIVGSTRLAAGTAQKAALNLLSTLTNIKLGAVHDGYMVNLVAGNGKLRSRAAAIVAAISGVDTEAAHTALTAAEGAIKPAVLLAMGAPAPAAARSILNQTGNNLRSAIALVKRW
jgi:N-acetylmuramic acid 6-phosphate etherase